MFETVFFTEERAEAKLEASEWEVVPPYCMGVRGIARNFKKLTLKLHFGRLKIALSVPVVVLCSYTSAAVCVLCLYDKPHMLQY